MGDMVSFPMNGTTAQGYLSVPESGSGPGVIVIQEWWGIVPHIRNVCDRFAAEGFVALAPDLYHGETTTEPDEAGKLMMALNVGAAAKDMSAAIDFLLANSAVTSTKVGVIGFCMGGGLVYVLAAERADAVGVAAPYYGLIPWEGAEPDYSKITAKIRGHYAGKDGFFGPEAVGELRAKLDAAGCDAVLTIHPGVDHAFFNDDRPEVFDAAAASAALEDTLAHFRSELR